jgi:hypothetical protein
MICELCESEESYNFHHFIPKTLHSNKWFKKRYTREEMSEGIKICKLCHKTIHKLIPDEKKLGKEYNTLTKLKKNLLIARYLQWKKKKKK